MVNPSPFASGPPGPSQAKRGSSSGVGAEKAAWRTSIARCWDRMRAGYPRKGLAAELHRAIALNEMQLDYQPKLHMRRRQFVGLEALLRWQHPTRGLIPPGAFIPEAEETDQIAALTMWVIARAAADQRTLIALGHDLPIFVNVAAILLADDRFVEQACNLIRATEMRIGLEITETSVIRDPGAAIANLHRVANMGISIAIDDYGAGLSSLAYLKQLPACELKIDKLFVTDLTRTHRDPLIVRSTIDLAHAMEMEVVAEGVEDSATFALLSVMGCDIAQGYLISRPLNLSGITAFLDRYRGGWTDAAMDTKSHRLGQVVRSAK